MSGKVAAELEEHHGKMRPTLVKVSKMSSSWQKDWASTLLT